MYYIYQRIYYICVIQAVKVNDWRIYFLQYLWKYCLYLSWDISVILFIYVTIILAIIPMAC